MIAITIYLIGCVLAYGRLKAQQKEYEELCGMKFPFDLGEWFFVALSWYTFITGTISYFVDKDKYFLKF